MQYRMPWIRGLSVPRSSVVVPLNPSLLSRYKVARGSAAFNTFMCAFLISEFKEGPGTLMTNSLAVATARHDSSHRCYWSGRIAFTRSKPHKTKAGAKRMGNQGSSDLRRSDAVAIEPTLEQSCRVEGNIKSDVESFAVLVMDALVTTLRAKARQHISISSS